MWCPSTALGDDIECLKMDRQGVHENRSGARAPRRGARGWQIWWGALGLIIGRVASCCAVGLPAQFWRLSGPVHVLGGLPAPLVVAAARGNPPESAP